MCCRFTDKDISRCCEVDAVCLNFAMGRSSDWNTGRFNHTEEERKSESPEVKSWSSLTETPAPLYLKRSPRRRRRGSLALMACPLRHSAVPVAYASCWLDSTSPWWERSPLAHWCLLPTPRSSSDLSYCWWPSPFSGPVACAAASPLPTARGGQRWAAGAPGWWDTAGWPAGRHLKSRPVSTPCRILRPCSSAPRPPPDPPGHPARRRTLPTRPCRAPASSSPWRPMALLLSPPAQSTQPPQQQEGRWSSTCHVKKWSPSRAETLARPECQWCKYPSGSRACWVWLCPLVYVVPYFWLWQVFSSMLLIYLAVQPTGN